MMNNETFFVHSDMNKILKALLQQKLQHFASKMVIT